MWLVLNGTICFRVILFLRCKNNIKKFQLFRTLCSLSSCYLCYPDSKNVRKPISIFLLRFYGLINVKRNPTRTNTRIQKYSLIRLSQLNIDIENNKALNGWSWALNMLKSVWNPFHCHIGKSFFVDEARMRQFSSICHFFLKKYRNMNANVILWSNN